MQFTAFALIVTAAFANASEETCTGYNCPDSTVVAVTTDAPATKTVTVVKTETVETTVTCTETDTVTETKVETVTEQLPCPTLAIEIPTSTIQNPTVIAAPTPTLVKTLPGTPRVAPTPTGTGSIPRSTQGVILSSATRSFSSAAFLLTALIVM